MPVRRPAPETGAYPVFIFVELVLLAGVLVLSTLHLGKPLRFYRGLTTCVTRR
jgi:DMSO reductase anchor subunit